MKMQNNNTIIKMIRLPGPESCGTHPKRRRRGWLMIDVLTTIAILVTLAGVLTALVYSAGKGNRMLWSRQQAVAAVEAQLDCLTAAGTALPADEFARRWPEFACTIEFTPADGPAAGLICAEVTVTGRVNKKSVVVTGRRYILETEPD